MSRHHFIAATLALGLTCTAHAGGTYRNIYSYTNSTAATSVGMWPQWEMTSDPATAYLYGVTPQGGPLGPTNAVGGGTLYRTDMGGNTTLLHAFGPIGDVGGSIPNGPILKIGTNFYGVTRNGGTSNNGVLYRWSATTGYKVLHHFGTGTDGVMPTGPLLYAKDGSIYGTTQSGGACNQGTVFRWTPSNGTYSTFHSLCGNDGNDPFTGIMQATDGNFYGTANLGGLYHRGTIFRLTPAGTFTVLKACGVNSVDTTYPGRLMQASNGLLYGTSLRGGDTWDALNGGGTIFSMSLSGTYTLLARTGWGNNYGQNPWYYSALIEKFTGIFYGVSNGSDGGEVFQFRASTNAVTVFHQFVPFNGTGSAPKAGLIVGADGNFWGSTTDGEFLTGTAFGKLYTIQGVLPNP